MHKEQLKLTVHKVFLKFSFPMTFFLEIIVISLYCIHFTKLVKKVSLVSFLYFFFYVSSGLISSEIWHMLTFKFSLKSGLGPTQCEHGQKSRT